MISFGKIKKAVSIRMVQAMTKFFSLFPREKTIYFESFHGKSFNDHPRALYEHLVQQATDYRLVWGVKKGYEKIFSAYPEVEYIQRFSWEWFRTLGRAKVWIINTRTPHHFCKNNQTIYLQTWHGTPLKKLGLDIEDVKMPGTTTEQYVANFKRESRRWDYLVSPNAYSSEIFRRAFGYEGELFEVGYPRNDVLVNDKENVEKVNSIKQKLNIPQDKKVILYAPTWRDNNFYSKGNYKFDLPFSVEKLMARLGDEVVLLVRMHYLVSDRFDFSAYQGKVVDASTYDEMSHLLLISDLLVTDYSSSFFDYSILERPIVFYMYDRQEYAEDIRGMYLDIDTELPGPIVETEADFIEALADAQLNGFEITDVSRYDIFRMKFNSTEQGTASEQIIQKILSQSHH
ncbi:CDP-glycerol glycerophosphotransferase family protein [Vagococcus zengguangii]|uniref:CDP-glycerol glycerophosphotransferase family protein n=1 Tax=Vagococcus zengguangii TaxID=2571750 RepID=UPI001BB10E75|nr:CDP-glycerol glycerophosphotransferase family protein [Vagococcus zengguangii]